MVDEFNRIIDMQHAPEELIEKTKKKMRKKQIAWYAYAMPAAAVAVAFVLVLHAGLGNEAGTYHYNTLSSNYLLSSEIVRSVDQTANFEDMNAIQTETYELKEGRVIVKSSEQMQVAPSELLGGTPSEYKGNTLYLGQSADAAWFFAAYSDEGTNFFIYGGNISEKDFEKFLKDFLNK